jgi:ribosome biogenesis protein BMS1
LGPSILSLAAPITHHQNLSPDQVEATSVVMDAIASVSVDKKHRVKKGDKAKKKAKGGENNNGPKPKNHKAFSVANVNRTKRNQQRNLDRQQKKELVPLVDRTEDLPPPALIVVMGPRGCGKSTLIRSLVKIYSGQNMTDTTGPITVLAGNKKRLTLMECDNDINSMTDLSKIADLVLLMVDASYGFEMDTFEFLNQLQLHGMPKVIGVMTHLDQFRASKMLQSTKKILKHRFWTEVYKGAKVFEFTNLINSKYPKHETKRLSLYISRVKVNLRAYPDYSTFCMSFSLVLNMFS